MQETNPFDALKEYLENLIITHGFNYLTDNPYKIYNEVVRKEIADRLSAGALLLSLLNDIPSIVEKAHNDVEQLANIISENTLLSRDTSTNLAQMYSDIFSPANSEKWEKLKYKGFKDFCANVWEFKSAASGVWRSKNKAAFKYSSIVNVKFSIEDSEQIKRNANKELLYNPFISADALHDYFEKIFNEYMSKKFKDLVTGDDYYEPDTYLYKERLPEDLEEFCEEYGFAIKKVSYKFIDPLEGNH